MTIPFSKYKRDGYITVFTPKGNEYECEYSNVRINRDTVPNGIYVYDCRSTDDDSERFLCQIRDGYIFVDHALTIVSDVKIEELDGEATFADDAWDYSFE